MTAFDPPTYVDTHAHLDEEQFAADIEAVIDKAHTAGVTAIINVGYHPSGWSTTLALRERFPTVSHMLGLHPNHSDEGSPSTFNELNRLVDESCPVAIGEIGIDLFRNHAPLSTQIDAFQRQLDLAIHRDLPVVIHQRAAEREVLQTLEQTPLTLRVLFHSFEGSLDAMSFAAERGYLIGIGGLFTRPKLTELRELIRTTPIDRIVLETDAPYLAPVGSHARRNEPANIPLIAQALAKWKDVPLDEIAASTTANANCFFGLAIA